jgi:hypothetical protein
MEKSSDIRSLQLTLGGYIMLVLVNWLWAYLFYERAIS